MDIFEQIKSMLNAAPYNPQQDDSFSEVKEEKKKVSNISEQGDKNIFMQLSKFAEKLENKSDNTLKAASRAIKYLLEMNKNLSNQLAEMQKMAEARELAKHMYERGLIEFNDIDNYINKIKDDISSWKKAVDLMGISSFGSKLANSGGLPSNVDPLYKILQEVGYGEV